MVENIEHGNDHICLFLFVVVIFVVALLGSGSAKVNVEWLGKQHHECACDSLIESLELLQRRWFGSQKNDNIILLLSNIHIFSGSLVAYCLICIKGISLQKFTIKGFRSSHSTMILWLFVILLIP